MKLSQFIRSSKRVTRSGAVPLVLLTSSICSQAAVDVEFVGTPWVDNIGRNTQRTFRFTNSTDYTFNLRGVRFSVPENTSVRLGSANQSTKLKAEDPWNGDRRYEIHAGSSIKGNSTKSATANGGGATVPTDWSPTDPQLLVKSRSFADMADFIDANPVTIDQIDSIIATSGFYDETHYEPDTLGINAPKYGAGFIDTYINQVDSTPVTQVQMNVQNEPGWLPKKNLWIKYRPDLMGTNDKVQGKTNKAGPLYSMALVAVQELMHIDKQFLGPMGLVETQAAFECWGNTGSGIGEYQGVIHLQGNSYASGMGPMHMEGTGFADKAIGSYPMFFPYAEKGNPKQWFTTPGTQSGNIDNLNETSDMGSCAGNSAQMVNATMIATLYCWKGYEQLFRSRDFYAKGIFEKAADRKLAAKLYMWGWQAGFAEGVMGGTKGETYSSPFYWPNATVDKKVEEIPDVTSYCSDYVIKVIPALEDIVDAQKNSELNGGDTKIIDMPITVEDMAEFFFGNDTPPYTSSNFAKQGKLGRGGILQHFPLTTEQRKQLWSDLTTAYDKMKGKAPTKDAAFENAVSFRYDWLTLLRIAKGYIYPQMKDNPYKPVMLPTPTNNYMFNSFVNNHSTKPVEIPGIPKKDEIFPNLKLDYYDVTADGDFQIFASGGDNEGLNISDTGMAAAEWTIDEKWQKWHDGKFQSGGEKDAKFLLTIPAQTIKDAFGEKDGMAWVRITDKVGNSVIDTIRVTGVKYPKIDSVYIIDTLGDGIGRTIKVHLTKGGADDADALDSWEELKYSWPDQDPNSFLDADRQTTTLDGTVLTITEPSYSVGDGLGLSRISYPSRKNYEKEILDRVGPAISLAGLDLNEPRDMDTLLLTISEPLAAITAGSGPYVILKKGTAEEKISADNIIKKSDNEYQFIFDRAKKLTEKEFVKFTFDGTTVEDLVGNTPLEINQWVPISMNGDKDAKFNFGDIYDRDGDGTGDSIFVDLILGNNPEHYTVSSITGVEYSWPTAGAFNALDMANLNELSSSQLSFVATDLSGGAGEGAVKLSFPENGLVPGAINDKVGAALHDSLYFDNSDRSRAEDTLRIRVTEDLAMDEISANHVYLQFAVDTNGTVDDIESITFSKLTQDSLITTVKAGALDETAYNWVRLKKENGAKDLRGNTPHQHSKWVPIARSGSETVLDSTTIYDTKGDGYGDNVVLHVTKGTDPAALNVMDAELKYKWPNENELTAATLQAGGGYFFGVDTDRFLSGAGEGTVQLAFPSFDMEGTITDRVGAALHDSLYFNNKDADRTEDILKIRVTESLNMNAILENHVYLQFAVDTTGTVDDVSSIRTSALDGDTILTTVKKGTMDATLYNWVRLKAEEGVQDLLGNTPHKTSKWVPIARSGSESTLDSAAIFDTRGDGYGDRVIVHVSNGTDPDAFDFGTVTEVFYKWTNENDFIAAQLEKSSGEYSFSTDTDLFKKGFGEGTLEIRLADQTLSCAIVDSVGPAITAAKRLFREIGGDDTVLVTVTETLKNNFVNDETYFTIIRGSDERDTKSNSVVQRNDTLEIIFPYGTIEENDSIAMIRNGGIEDFPGNIPHEDNSHILIELIGGKRPTETFGEIYDNNGDGVADSIEAEITLGSHATPDLAVDMLSAKYSWPTADDFQDIPNFSAGSNTTLKLTGFTAAATFGEGALELTFPSGSVRGTLTDKVGPVITKALLWENVGGDKDTLQVTFSEDIAGMSNGAEFINVNGSAKYSHIASRYLGNNSWLFSFDRGTVAVGDMVNIIAGSTLRDEKENRAHRDNIEVEVQMKKRAITVDEGASYYLDRDTDGELDYIEIRLRKEVDADRISEFSVSFEWLNENGTVEGFTTSDIEADGSDIITVNVSDLNLKKGMTYVDGSRFGELTLSQPDDDMVELHTTVFTPKDRMAPVLIDRAAYRGKKLTSDEEKFHDTLVLIYSEEVEKIRDEKDEMIFDLKDGGDHYRLTVLKEVGRNGHEVHYVVEVTRGESVIPAEGDLISIENGKIADRAGNVQDKDNPYVPFGMVLIPAEYEVVIFPNPFTVGSKEVNELVKHYSDGSLDAEGQLAVMVRPFGNRVAADLSGDITVYDVVGNVVISKQELRLQDSGVLLLVNEGRNDSGRKLGTGQYRAMISVKSGDQTNVIPVMMGIKQ